MPTIKIERKDGSFQVIKTNSDMKGVNPHDIAHDTTQGNYKSCTISGKKKSKSKK